MSGWVIYTRVSTEDQAAGGISLDAQLHSCRAMLTAHGWPLADEVTDPGASGKSLERPGMRRVLAAIRGRACRGVLVWRLDRLTRSLRDLIAILEAAGDAVAIVSVTESLDTSTPMGRFVVHLLGAIAQWERETNGARVSSARQHAKRQGYWSGGAVPAGMQLESVGNGTTRKRLVLSPHAPAVVPIWQRILDGQSLRQISDHLREAGVPATQRLGVTTTTGWTPATARNLLLSPQVVGHLVDAATQSAVRAALMSRNTPMRRGQDSAAAPRPAEHESPFRGIARCHACGAALVQVMARGNGGAYPYFRCSARPKGLCRAKDLRCAVVEAAAWAAIRDAIADGTYRAAVAANLDAQQAAASTAGERLAKAMHDHDQIRARLADLALHGPRPGTPEYVAQLTPLATRLRELELDVATCQGQASAHRMCTINAEYVLDSMAADVATIETRPPHEQRALAQALTRSVAVGADEVVVELFSTTPVADGDGSLKSQKWRARSHDERTVRLTARRQPLGLPRRKRRAMACHAPTA